MAIGRKRRKLTKGAKYDQGKLRFDLVSPEAEIGEALVYTVGARKYDDRNWEKGIKFSRIYGALRRHLIKFIMGEDMDPEGFHHMDAVRWNAGVLRTFIARGMGKKWDDIPTRRHLYRGRRK